MDARAEVDELLATLDRERPHLRYEFIRFLAEQLADCCQAFDGDLDQVLLMAVLCQRSLGAQHMARLDPDKASDMAWMAALRIADVTGLPRETVRRKLKTLEARQWVRHDPQKGWAVAGDLVQARMNDDLARFEQRLRRRIIRLLLGLRPFLD
jgi:predicted transcriptional regulator